MFYVSMSETTPVSSGILYKRWKRDWDGCFDQKSRDRKREVAELSVVSPELCSIIPYSMALMKVHWT